ncbi:hypothetical protein [Ralstonia pseudosolanacearum]|uniref:hypothetical protein n=1 Tax=Ralstonia pseudosolanacearum TaxID=1310165 RepID=UPI0018D013DF|nr:hypothetical protein [Ralstonia pseudosolanacearum]
MKPGRIPCQRIAPRRENVKSTPQCKQQQAGFSDGEPSRGDCSNWGNIPPTAEPPTLIGRTSTDDSEATVRSRFLYPDHAPGQAKTLLRPRRHDVTDRLVRALVERARMQQPVAKLGIFRWRRLEDHSVAHFPIGMAFCCALLIFSLINNSLKSQPAPTDHISSILAHPHLLFIKIDVRFIALKSSNHCSNLASVMFLRRSYKKNQGGSPWQHPESCHANVSSANSPSHTHSSFLKIQFNSIQKYQFRFSWRPRADSQFRNSPKGNVIFITARQSRDA